MLTRNYSAIADQTQRPFGTTKSVRKNRSWSWNPNHRKPGKCRSINPQQYEKELAHA